MHCTAADQPRTAAKLQVNPGLEVFTSGIVFAYLVGQKEQHHAKSARNGKALSSRRFWRGGTSAGNRPSPPGSGIYSRSYHRRLLRRTERTPLPRVRTLG